MVTTGQDQADAEFLASGGELGARIRNFDWTQTALGAPGLWPKSLKTAVRIMLTSRQPMFVWWGKDLINLYNDAYKAIVGGKHPAALGQPAHIVWQEIWDQIRPRAESAMRHNEGTYDEALLLIMERNGYPEETYYTFSYSPVPDDSGGTGGIFCANTDDTPRIVGKRQLSLLRELARCSAEARTIDEACAQSAAGLATDLHDFPFAMIYRTEADGRAATLAGLGGLSRGHARAPATIQLDRDEVWPVASMLKRNGAFPIPDCEGVRADLPCGVWPLPPHQAIAIPIASSGPSGRPAVLIAGLNPYRIFDSGYQDFVEMVSAQIGINIANAAAYEEARERADSLARLDRAKTVFFSNVSHEFRTPLTLMLGPLEDVLANAGNLEPEQHQLLAVAQRNGMRLLKLVNTLLDFSRIEAGRAQLSYEEIDLAARTADLASMFRSAIEKAGMRLIIDCQTLPQMVSVDSDMWEKIVLNLVSNAFKYTMAGEIEVSMRAEADMAVLSVRDTGIGIPPHEVPMLFNRFHRVEGAHGRTHEGTGIGLALVHELVKLHKGSVHIDSVEGIGSIFTVSLPFGPHHPVSNAVRAEHAQASPPKLGNAFVDEALSWLPVDAGDRSPEAGPDGSSPSTETAALSQGREVDSGARARLLLADDNADMRAYVAQLLAPLYEVKTVADGRLALDAIAEQVPDILITDVMMPNVDGFALIDALRSNPRTASIPIIMLSARAGEEARIEGLNSGADDYLIKPFGARELLAKVAAQVSLSRLRGELLQREQFLRSEAEQLNEVARGLTGELDLQSLIRKITNVATVLTYAESGTFLYTSPDEQGDSHQSHSHSIESPHFFEELGISPEAPLLAETLGDKQVVRIDDLNRDLRLSEQFRHSAQSSLRSYLAVPVVSRSGEILGGLFFGHSRPGVFTLHAERLALGIAAQAAIALDNAHLYGRAQNEIKERERVALALHEADQRKNEFLATLAHELRNPLVPLLNGVELIRNASADQETIVQAREMMARQLGHMVRLVDDLLDLSRITQDKVELHREKLELSDILQAAAETCRPFIDHRHQTLTIDVPDVPLYMDGDATRLSQVFSNLLNNASRYADDRGLIELRMTTSGKEAVIAIKDNGVGIPAEMLPHIFEMFVQVDQSRERGRGGLGIGLTLVKRLLEMHDGRVEARSEGLGRGSEFIVHLPLLESAAAMEQTSSDPQRGPSVLRRHRVLLADDHEDAVTSMAMVFELMGAEVRVARTGLEAVDMSIEFKPSFIIMDIGMPGLNGYEACRRIRAHPSGRDAMIVALTGWGQSEDRKRSKEAGFDHHLVKPASMDAIEKLLLACEHPENTGAVG